MPFDPTDAVGEIQGRKAVLGHDPAANGFHCPYINDTCKKRSTNLGVEPYALCTMWKGRIEGRTPESDLICVCPKRFHQVDFLQEVMNRCWPFAPAANPVMAREVQMKGFGNVDFVIADKLPDGSIGNFLSVELQAVDITGSGFPAYQAIRNGHDLPKRPTYGFNWDNVYKRYITQLIRKGYFHHHWRSKIVAVIQDQVYDYLLSRADFLRLTALGDPQVNIIFMTYVLEDDPNDPGQYRPAIRRVEGTSHINIQNAIMYQAMPDIDRFKAKVSGALIR